MLLELNLKLGTLASNFADNEKMKVLFRGSVYELLID